MKSWLCPGIYDAASNHLTFFILETCSAYRELRLDGFIQITLIQNSKFHQLQHFIHGNIPFLLTTLKLSALDHTYTEPLELQRIRDENTKSAPADSHVKIFAILSTLIPERLPCSVIPLRSVGSYKRERGRDSILCSSQFCIIGKAFCVAESPPVGFGINEAIPSGRSSCTTGSLLR